jgi:hypothetical protein
VLDNFVLFKGIAILKHYIPKKHKWFGIKLYRLCSSKGYTYNMTVYLGKDRIHVTASMTVTHASVAGLAARIGYMGHELYMNIFFYFQRYLTMYILRQ